MRAPRSTRFLALCIGVSIQSLWAACGGGDGSGDITAPEVGALDVSTETEGVEQDPDGYTVAVDGGAPRRIGLNASLRFENLARGIHTVVLGGAARNCSVSGNGSATAQVARGETASLRFVVSCLATTGAIEVTTSTGTDADADGYSLLLDGVEVQTIGASATLTLSSVNSGPHTVGLSGIAANCQVQGDNPRALEVTAGATATVAIVVACAPPPPATGSLRVSASTTGESLPAGYTVSVDGGSAQPIGANATIALSNLAPGPHTVQLGGVADNCSVTDPNPRTLDVSAGGTAETTFTISCAAVSGALRVTTRTTGSALDADGYDVTVDGGAGTSIGINANRTIGDLAAGSHQVALGGVAGNCQVQGENPRSITVTAGPAATTTFEVVCAATSGSLAVTITGLPAGVDAAVTVTGPDNYNQTVRATRTLGDLTPGSYTVAAAQVANGDQYTASPETQTASVAAGATASAGVAYARVPGATLNLRVEGLYLTQSVQTLTRDVPLVEGRDGMLRVFVVANENNTVRPDVRVRLFDGNTLRQTLTIPAPQSSTPTSLNEGALDRSWNVAVPGSVIRRGLQIVADVDPANAIVESDESDNALPVSGPRLQLQVRTAPALGVTLVPVLQSANDFQGDVTEANKNRYVDQVRRLYPVSEVHADVHAVYTTKFAGALEPGNGNNAWNEVLNEILTLQAVEGTDRSYYGVVRTGYPDGMNGNGFLEAPAAIGYDNAADGGRVAAHEMGHTWGRLHSACGNPLDVDPSYPYANGTIGVYGLDVAAAALKAPSQPDIMGYCGSPWISDYNYKGVLDYRGAQAFATREARAQTSLLVWGRIVGGQAILEPAFQVVTRPMRPRRGGPYSVSGYAADGSRLFEFPFDAAQVADDPRGARQFAIAIPLGESAGARLATLRLSGPGVQATASARTTVAVPSVADASPALRPSAAGVALEWKTERHPMVVVRDPVTGEVLSFARGGRVEIRTSRRELDLIVSDGLRSTVTRARVTDR
jgi:hypothetical protein